MKCGARVAIGVAAGYFLGRTKKMKLALMLGGMAAGRHAGGPGELLGQGAKLLEASPELAALRDQIQGRLVEAGKDAVMAVAARQLESLGDRVTARVERFGDPSRVGGLRDVVDNRDGGGAGDSDVADHEDAEDEDYVDEEPAEDRDHEAAAHSGGGRGTQSRARQSAASRSADRERADASSTGRATGNRGSKTVPSARRAAAGVSGGARAGARAATARARRTRSER